MIRKLFRSSGTNRSAHDGFLWSYVILILSVASLVMASVLSHGDFKPEILRIVSIADYFICLLFLADFVKSLTQADDKWRYLRTWGWLDLLSSIPAAPLLRFGRVGRIIRLVRTIRVVKEIGGIRGKAGQSRAASALILLLTCSFLAVIAGAILVLEAEHHHGGNIQTAEEAIWWAFVTMTTVGYGDYVPSTLEGRCIAAVLMIFGIGLFGTFTGYVANWFDVPEEEAERSRELQLLGDVAALRREVGELRTLLEGLHSTPNTRTLPEGSQGFPSPISSDPTGTPRSADSSPEEN